MTISGTLIKKLEVQRGISKTGKEWKKQSIIIEQEDQYKTKVCIDVMGDKIERVEKMEVGNHYDISVNVGSREYNGKWYTNISGWFFANEKTSSQMSKADDVYNDNEDNNDLPF